MARTRQSYFRETALYHALSPLLQFPPSIELHDTVPQEFALQFWDQHKMTNSSLVLSIIGIFAGSKGSNVCPRLPQKFLTVLDV